MRDYTEFIISQLWVMGGLLAQDLKTVVIMFVFAVAWFGLAILKRWNE